MLSGVKVDGDDLARAGRNEPLLVTPHLELSTKHITETTVNKTIGGFEAEHGWHISALCSYALKPDATAMINVSFVTEFWGSFKRYFLPKHHNDRDVLRSYRTHFRLLNGQGISLQLFARSRWTALRKTHCPK